MPAAAQPAGVANASLAAPPAAAIPATSALYSKYSADPAASPFAPLAQDSRTVSVSIVSKLSDRPAWQTSRG